MFWCREHNYKGQYGPCPLCEIARRRALAAATGTAETNEDLAQCEASQSGGDSRNAQPHSPREQEG